MKVRIGSLLLLLCLGISIGQTKQVTVDIPDKIEIGLLENIFNPVLFDHKLHADMTKMGGGVIPVTTMVPKVFTNPVQTVM